MPRLPRRHTRPVASQGGASWNPILSSFPTGEILKSAEELSPWSSPGKHQNPQRRRACFPWLTGVMLSAAPTLDFPWPDSGSASPGGMRGQRLPRVHTAWATRAVWLCNLPGNAVPRETSTLTVNSCSYVHLGELISF